MIDLHVFSGSIDTENNVYLNHENRSHTPYIAAAARHTAAYDHKTIGERLEEPSARFAA